MLPTLIHALIFGKEVVDLTEKTLDKVSKLEKSKSKRSSEARSAIHTLHLVCIKGRCFLESVSEFIRCTSEDGSLQRANVCVQRGDFSHNRLLLYRMKGMLEKANKDYENFIEACISTRVNCFQSYQECIMKKSKSKIVPVSIGVGTSITGAALAVGGGAALTGIGISLAIGPLTLGIGTIVGFTVTAGAVAIGSGIAAIAIPITIWRTRRAGESFKELGELFKSVAETAMELHKNIEQIRTVLDRPTASMDTVEYCCDTALTDQSCEILEMLYRTCREIDTKKLDAFNHVLEKQAKLLDDNINECFPTT